MKNRILAGIVIVLLAAGAMAHGDTVVRQSGEVIRGRITESGPFLEVETYDGGFLILRKEEVRRAVRAGGEVIASNETKAQEQQRKQKQQPDVEDLGEYVVLPSGEKIRANIRIYGNVVEVRKPGEGVKILSKDDIIKVVNQGLVVMRNEETGRPLPEPIQVGSVMYPTREVMEREDREPDEAGPMFPGPGGGRDRFGPPGRGRGFGPEDGGFGRPGGERGGDRGSRDGGEFRSPEGEVPREIPGAPFDRDDIPAPFGRRGDSDQDRRPPR